MSALTVAFVGQCHTVGYPGVPPDAAFPEVCRADLQASRRERHVRVHLQPYYHPSELVEAVREALVQQPRVVVIEVVGWLAVVGTRAVDLSRLPSGVRSAYERVRHFRHVAHAVARRVPRGAELIATRIAASVLKPLLPRYPRPSVAEYESAVVHALELVRSTPGADAVIQGPGAPNLTLDGRGIAGDAVARYREVREMAQRVAAAHGVLFVDRWDTVTGAFYTDNSVRPAAGAHSVWGHLLAEELLRAGLV